MEMGFHISAFGVNLHVNNAVLKCAESLASSPQHQLAQQEKQQMLGSLRRFPGAATDQTEQPPLRPTFSIITPVFNGRTFLDEAILSVVTQAGPFSIRYHVQDGGSSDGTLDILKRWSERLSGDFPIVCNDVEFSYASAEDGGLYDAVNKGFGRIGDGDFMSWINADDRYQPGAFASVAQIFQKFSDVRWIASRPAFMSEAGAQGELLDLRSFPQRAIAAAIFDGRFSPLLLQQEGMFWRSSLWQAVGGLNGAMRLAGDFDLWRRFAQHADLVMTDALLGVFRFREGQLSASIEKYQKEIDGVLSAEEMALRSEMAEAFRAATTPEAVREAGFVCRVANNVVSAGGWHLVELQDRPALQKQLAEFKRSRWTKLGCLLRLTKLRDHLQE
jgi:hypothetical protein